MGEVFAGMDEGGAAAELDRYSRERLGAAVRRRPGAARRFAAQW